MAVTNEQIFAEVKSLREKVAGLDLLNQEAQCKLLRLNVGGDVIWDGPEVISQFGIPAEKHVVILGIQGISFTFSEALTIVWDMPRTPTNVTVNPNNLEPQQGNIFSQVSEADARSGPFFPIHVRKNLRLVAVALNVNYYIWFTFAEGAMDLGETQQGYHGDITQVGTDQMGDAIEGSEYFRVGDKLRVK